MAVPKKKISYSKTRQRFICKQKKLSLYKECNSCLHFIKMHHVCIYCSLNKVSSIKLYKTNIKEIFNIGF
jgi:ribosomal protein L32